MMKKLLLAFVALFMINAIFAQEVVKTRNLNTIAKTKIITNGREEAAPMQVNPIVRANSHNFIGTTYYDLQTNGSMSQRMAYHSDGKISAIWNTNASTSSSTRGTGYNYFNGSSWINDAASTARIENTRTGWGTLATIGDAEIVAAHNGTTALVISVNPQRGSGNWTYSTLVGPNASTGSSTSTCLLWPNMVANGNTLHLIACTESDAGYLYNGIHVCLLYYRGTFDPTTNTITWEAPRVVGNVTASEVAEFSGDSYAIACNGNNVAILNAASSTDVFLWKSTDNGDNFTKTTIFQHPYPGYSESTTLVLDTPYVSDGSCAVAVDNSGMAHVAFGLTRLLNDDITDGKYSYFPGVTGMLYRNESMNPIAGSTASTLDPDNLEAAGYTIIKRADLNNDGGAYFANGGDFPGYGCGGVSMPQLVIDGSNIYLVYTEWLDWPFLMVTDEVAYYRGVFAQKSTDNGATWSDVSWLSYSKEAYYIDDWAWAQDTGYTLSDLQDLNIFYNEADCVFPSVAPQVVNGKLAMTWQQDYFAGCEIKENNVAMAENPSNITFFTIDADEIGTFNKTDEVSQGLWQVEVGIVDNTLSNMKLYPNPATDNVNILIASKENANAQLNIFNLMGQLVYSENVAVAEGNNLVRVSTSNLQAGVYMVNIKTNAGTSTQKLIVK